VGGSEFLQHEPTKQRRKDEAWQEELWPGGDPL
jgi:hypothetical protein